MYQGKHVSGSASNRTSKTPKRKRRLSWRKEFVVLISILVLMIGVTGGSLAYLAAQTDSVINTFVPGTVSSRVDEDPFDGETKSNVIITNTGNTAAYIRAMIIATWQKDGSNGEIYPEQPILGTDYTISGTVTSGTDGYWISANGYYYFTLPVEAGSSTATLIGTCSSECTAPDGYHLVIDIIADAIQATPHEAVESAWTGVSIDDTTKVLSITSGS